MMAAAFNDNKPTLTAETPVVPVVGLNKVAWWAAFMLATVSLSLLFQAFKTFSLEPAAMSGVSLLGASLLFVLALLLLVYDGYAKEKAKGKVVKKFQPFEWLFHKQGGFLGKEEGDGQ